MFRAIILPIFRSTRLCYSLWYNAPTMLPAYRPATSWVHYTTSCNTQFSAPEDGQSNYPKHVELTGIINKPLLLHLVGCLYYLYIIIIFLKLAKKSQFIPPQNVMYFITLPFFLVRQILIFYINDVIGCGVDCGESALRSLHHRIRTYSAT